MKIKITFSIVLWGALLGTLSAQGIVLGGNATFKIGTDASFYAGPNTTFNGTVTNNGEIISYSDLDFVANRDVGSLKFVGIGDQNLSGDTLDVANMEVDKSGSSNVVLLTDQVVVSGSLNVTNGVVQAENELDLLVSGSSDKNGQGFVEGQLVGLTSGQDVSFPMGVGGNPNYLTLSNTTPGTIVRVECNAPDAGTLNGEEDVDDISESVQWLLQSLNGGTTEATVSIDFSGVLLTPNNTVRATTREPAVLVLAPGDSLFRILQTAENGLSDLDIESNENPPTTGSILTTDPITIGAEPIRLVVAWVPVIDGIEFFVPNTFAPNGTFTENRTFRPFFSGELVTSVSMTVINSLSSEVYSIAVSGDDVDLSLIGWDGRLPSGQDAPGGVYYYSVNLISASGRQTKAGTVLLVE